jgi:hypothetical protein
VARRARPLDDERCLACQAMAVVAILLSEVAEAIDTERGEQTDAC